MQFLFDFKKGKFSNFSLLEVFYIILDEEKQGFKYYLIVTHEAIVCCNLFIKEKTSKI